jgi:site-specific DNA-adenine methylase
MTRYHGGKQRQASHIATVIAPYLRDTYCEPFCGMLSVFSELCDTVQCMPQTCLIGDAALPVVAMWDRAASQQWVPPTRISLQQWHDIKVGDDQALKGYVGHQFSYGGVYFASATGTLDTIDTSDTTHRKNTSHRASQRVVRIGNQLAATRARIQHGHYTQFDNELTDSVIYRDPPYGNTQCRYVNGDDRVSRAAATQFDTDAFWHWARTMSLPPHNNALFVSEYTAPHDFACILDTQHQPRSQRGRTAHGTDKLYLHRAHFEPAL